MASCNGNNGFPSASDAKKLARNNSVIWAEICAIQQAILTATSGCEYDETAMQCFNNGGDFCVIVGGQTPMSYRSAVSDVNVTVPGQDYFPVVATATITHPIGTGATADVTVSDSGVVTGFTVTAGGTDYDPIVATADFTTLAGSGAVVTLIVDETTGAITDTVIVNAGVNYLVGEVIPVSHLTGTGAVLEIQSVGSGGEIQTIAITDGGQDYQTIVAEVTVNHPTGLGFEGLVQVALGSVVGITVIDGGLLYNDLLPTILIEDITGNGAGAETVTDVGLTLGELVDVIVTAGGANYSSDTTGTVVPAPTSSGADAEVEVVIDLNPFNTNPRDYYLSLIGQLDDCGIKDQIEQVLAYFRDLGYVIEAQVDPETGSTIRWEVCWC
jgi:hypothetical protein